MTFPLSEIIQLRHSENLLKPCNNASVVRFGTMHRSSHTACVETSTFWWLSHLLCKEVLQSPLLCMQMVELLGHLMQAMI